MFLRVVISSYCFLPVLFLFFNLMADTPCISTEFIFSHMYLACIRAVSSTFLFFIVLHRKMLASGLTARAKSICPYICSLIWVIYVFLCHIYSFTDLSNSERMCCKLFLIKNPCVLSISLWISPRIRSFSNDMP